MDICHNNPYLRQFYSLNLPLLSPVYFTHASVCLIHPRVMSLCSELCCFVDDLARPVASFSHKQFAETLPCCLGGRRLTGAFGMEVEKVCHPLPVILSTHINEYLSSLADILGYPALVLWGINHCPGHNEEEEERERVRERERESREDRRGEEIREENKEEWRCGLGCDELKMQFVIQFRFS